METVAQVYKDWWSEMVPNGTGQAQTNAMKMAFYSGALASLGLLCEQAQAVMEGRVGKKDFSQSLDRMRSELQNYFAATAGGRG